MRGVGASITGTVDIAPALGSGKESRRKPEPVLCEGHKVKKDSSRSFRGFALWALSQEEDPRLSL